MSFNNYYKLDTNYNEPPIKKEISRSIRDIIREKRIVGYDHNNIIKYYRILFKRFPNNKNTRILYGNRIYITELRKKVTDATKKIIEGNYTIPAFEIDNEKLTNTFKKSVYKTLRSKQAPKKKKNKKGIKVK